ncbi:protein singed wings 2-like [Cherax quadricarinatus]
MQCSVSVGLWVVVTAMVIVGAEAFTYLKRKFGPDPIITYTNPSCRSLPRHNEVVCEGLKSLEEVTSLVSSEQLPQVTTLTIAHANISSFTLDDLVSLTSLHTLMFNFSYVKNWTAPHLDPLPSVTTLLLNHCWDNNMLKIIEKKPTLVLTSQMLSYVPSLEELYLVDCFLMQPEKLEDVKHLRKLHIIDGGVGCDSSNLWLLDWFESGRASISRNTTCYIPTVHDMATLFSLSGRELLMWLRYKKETERECVAPCNCSVTGIKENLDPIIHVDCQEVGLTELPIIPHNTTRLTLDRNNITNMSLLFTSELYHHIDSIALNYNRISYMDGELYYNYIKNRSMDIIIKLAYNGLKTMPVKIMKQVHNEAAKEGKNHLPMFDLSNNPWNCDDCSFLPDFQELVYYQNYEMDPSNIRCANWTSTAGQQVVKLDVNSLCAPDPPLLQPLDILNICMGILLLMLIFNFLHNFVQYKRHGKLPWIITKLPCC